MGLILRSGLSKARTYHFDSVAIVEGLEGCWWENGEAVVEFRGIVRDVRSRSSTLQATGACQRLSSERFHARSPPTF